MSKIIGTTTSGKDIPAITEYPYNVRFRLPKCSGEYTLLGPVHTSNLRRKMREFFPGWTAQEHLEAAAAYNIAVTKEGSLWDEAVTQAERNCPKPGYMIGGTRHGFTAGRTHPDYSHEDNDRIRQHAFAVTLNRAAAFAHKIAAKYIRG